MNTAGLIVAAGRGHRVGGALPKQYQLLRGQCVLRHTVQAMLASPEITRLLVVIHPDDAGLYGDAVAGLDDPRLLPAVSGGAERYQSVLAGLEMLSTHRVDKVLIHDAARPLLGIDVVERVLGALMTHVAVMPAIPVVDTLWAENSMQVTQIVPRDHLWRAQTPQGFDFATILDLHRANVDPVSDDVALARKAGIDVAIVPGDTHNFKVTLAGDFARAERLIGGQMDIRTGTGFDVHAFCPGDALTLCGVTIPHDQGLKGHSDADVAMHAITDAIFGALAEGDIGQWFPPSDPQWKGAASDIFLEKAVARASERGFAITHIDCTIICEHPKIGPHAADMRREIARIADLDIERVSVKATTSERLGFTGRGEGIAAQAAATLVKQ